MPFETRDSACMCSTAQSARVAWRRTVAVALLLTAAALPRAAAQEEPPPRTVTVTGEGNVRSAPELARVRMGVFTEAKTAQAASRDNAGKMERVVAALGAAGIPTARIQTVQLTIEPAYDYEQPHGRPILRGFQARNIVEAEVEELARLGEILDAAIAVGGNTVEGIQFELRDLGAAQSRALEGAVADARRKAEALARTTGHRLGAVRQMTASTGGPPIPYAGQGVAMMEARAAGPPPVSPGELTITSTVTVVFALE